MQPGSDSGSPLQAMVTWILTVLAEASGSCAATTAFFFRTRLSGASLTLELRAIRFLAYSLFSWLAIWKVFSIEYTSSMLVSAWPMYWPYRSSWSSSSPCVSKTHSLTSSPGTRGSLIEGVCSSFFQAKGSVCARWAKKSASDASLRRPKKPTTNLPVFSLGLGKLVSVMLTRIAVSPVSKAKRRERFRPTWLEGRLVAAVASSSFFLSSLTKMVHAMSPALFLACKSAPSLAKCVATSNEEVKWRGVFPSESVALMSAPALISSTRAGMLPCCAATNTLSASTSCKGLGTEGSWKELISLIGGTRHFVGTWEPSGSVTVWFSMVAPEGSLISWSAKEILSP
mmetsp:Transcript_28203/g.55476  ORF Transcript_28203/g.55476 Transcript_28203/m.55476 type:complete len:342 (-) Transcript_28203:2787-3812(-)